LAAVTELRRASRISPAARAMFAALAPGRLPARRATILPG